MLRECLPGFSAGPASGPYAGAPGAAAWTSVHGSLGATTSHREPPQGDPFRQTAPARACPTSPIGANSSASKLHVIHKHATELDRVTAERALVLGNIRRIYRRRELSLSPLVGLAEIATIRKTPAPPPHQHASMPRRSRTASVLDLVEPMRIAGACPGATHSLATSAAIQAANTVDKRRIRP